MEFASMRRWSQTQRTGRSLADSGVGNLGLVSPPSATRWRKSATSIYGRPEKKLLYAPLPFPAIVMTVRTVPATEGRMEGRIGSVIGHLRRTALLHDRTRLTAG